MNVKEFFINIARGAAIGVSMIIPGVSGGTIAVLLNVYEKLINAVGNLRRDFKNSFFFLLPIILGVGLSVAAMYFPIRFALDKAPLPTILLFAGLMVGSIPKVFKDALNTGFDKKIDIVASVIPFLLVIGVCFVPGLGDVDLSPSMPVYGYFLLILVGAAASCALVVPGISGSMLLLIFGYYNSVLDAVSAIRTDPLHSVLVLGTLAVGILIGFFSIAKLMKLFLHKFPRATRWVIIGFVLGSIPALFITFNGNFPQAPLNAWQIAVGVILCVLGAVGTYCLTAYVEKCEKLKEQTVSEENQTTVNEPDAQINETDGNDE